MPVLLKLYLYLAIGLSWASIGIVHLARWFRYRRRTSDRDLGFLFMLCSASFSLYGAESLWQPAVLSQLAVDLPILFLSTYVFVKSVTGEGRLGVGGPPPPIIQ